MSRILVTGINYAPESIGTGKYTSEMCEWLAARGHCVRVVTSSPYYPEWKTWPEYRGRRFHREHRNGVDLIRCPIWIPSDPRGFTRILHLATFGLSSAGALASSRHWKPDWVMNIAPTLASAPAALFFAKMVGARSWLHIQDFEVDAAIDLGIVHARGLRRMALAAESALLRRFDMVSTISPGMQKRLADKGVTAGRRVLFPNWVDLDHIVPLERPSSYRAQLGIPAGAVVALYSGNMGQKQGLDLLGEAAHQLAGESNIQFVFGGDGPGRIRLQQICLNLPNVRFLELQSSERLCDWLALADIHLLPQRADAVDLVMPSKLTGMLASGRAVLATSAPGTSVAEAVKSCGIVTEPGNTEAFVSALRKLANDHSLRDQLGRSARQLAVDTLGRDSILGRFEQHIAPGFAKRDEINVG